MNTEQVILSDKLKELSLESAMIYLLLRADCIVKSTGTAQLQEQCSGLLVQTIAQSIGHSTITIDRCLNDLCKRDLIVKQSDGTFKLGEGGIWYFDIPPQAEMWKKEEKHSSIEKIRLKIKEDRERIRQEKERKRLTLPEEIKQRFRTEILSDIISDPDAREVVIKHFKLEYYKKWREQPKLPDGKDSDSQYNQVNIYVNKGLKIWENADKFCEMISWALDNWEKLTAHKIVEESRLKYGYLGNSRFWGRIDLCKKHGFIKFRESLGPKFIADYFEKKHKQLFGYSPQQISASGEKLVELKLKNKFVADAVSTIGSEGLMDLIDFIFGDWPKLKVALKWEGSPSWGMLKSEGLLKMLQSWKENGVPEREWTR